MRTKIRVGPPRRLARLLVLAGLLVAAGVAGWLAWLKIGAGEPGKTQQAANQPAQENYPAPKAPQTPPRSRPARGSVLGQFEAPALNMSWVVLEGTDEPTLDRGIGHIEGTAGIGEGGNIGIAGHRHTYFRKMEWIRPGDEIVLKSGDGTFRYRVNYVRLHRPTDVEVLAPAYGPAVTLVTCFPFEYVGSAPLRLIVRAVATGESLTRLLAPQSAGRGLAAGN
jgi:sortase A